jgi:HTH-type transcriptional regulator/antitoxin HigA
VSLGVLSLIEVWQAGKRSGLSGYIGSTTRLIPRRFEMKIKVIKTEMEHKAALKMIEALWDARPRTPRGDDLELLTTLVEAYEDQKHAILPPHPIEAIKFRMEQEGLNNSDLAKILGGKNRASEIMRKKRGLSLGMIRNLHTKLQIPAESLLAA